MRQYLLIVIWITVGSPSLLAVQDIKPTSQMLDSITLETFVKQNVATNSWPKLTSDGSRDLSGSNAEKPSDLGILLLHKISSYESATGHDAASSLNAAILYSTLSSLLKQSGGYINLCLADAVNRLAIARVSELLEEKIGGNSIDYIKTLSSTRFPAQAFLNSIHDESSLKLASNIDLVSLDEKTLRERVNRAVGADEMYVLQQYANGHQTTGWLIENIDVAVLLHRMGQTEVSGEVGLSGLAEFYKLGGHLKDISIMDNRPFKAVMNGNESNFKSDLMHVNKVTATLILEMLREIGDHSPSSFVGIAMH